MHQRLILKNPEHPSLGNPQHSISQHHMSTSTPSMDTQNAKEKVARPVASMILSNHTTAINWFHVGVIAPGLAMLKYRPQYIQYMPYVGGFVAVTHLFALSQKDKKGPATRAA